MAINLGCTLAGIFAPERCGLPMSAAEISFWLDFRRLHGFPLERIEVAVALSGSAMCQVRGAKVKASDLMPSYGPRPMRTLKDGHKMLLAFLDRPKKRLRGLRGKK